MKTLIKFSIAVIATALLATLSGCGQSQATSQKPVKEYYNTPGSNDTLDVDNDAYLDSIKKAKVNPATVEHDTTTIYVGAKGGKYQWRKSHKTGNWYKKYLPKK